jgi:hypothetical protein
MFSVVYLTIGGAFFLSAAQSAFNNQLIKQMPLVIDAYMTGLKAVFATAVAAFGVATLVGFFGSWKKLHSEDMEKAAAGVA